MPHHPSSLADLPPQDPYEDISGSLSIAIEVTMVMANIFPIFVVWRTKRVKERMGTDEIIVALSITDILSVLIPTPMGLISYYSKTWYGGEKTCEFYQLTTLWFQLTSMCLVTYMCVDRLGILLVAMSFQTPVTNTTKIKAITVGIYLFTFIVVCLPVAGLGPEALSSSGRLCESWIIAIPKEAKQHIFYIVFLVVGFVNMAVAMVVNSKVIIILWKFQQRLNKRKCDRDNPITLPVDRSILVDFTVMIIMVTVVLYLTWMPTLIMITLQKCGYEVSVAAVLYSLLSTTLTGLLNPIIYAVFSRSYRRGYKKLICCIVRVVCGCPRKDFVPIDDSNGPGEKPENTTSATTSIAALLPDRPESTLEIENNVLQYRTDMEPNRLSFTSSNVLRDFIGPLSATNQLMANGYSCGRRDTKDQRMSKVASGEMSKLIEAGEANDAFADDNTMDHFLSKSRLSLASTDSEHSYCSENVFGGKNERLIARNYTMSMEESRI